MWALADCGLSLLWAWIVYFLDVYMFACLYIPFFEAVFFSGTQDWPSRLECLVSDPEGSVCLCLPFTRITSACYHAWLFLGRYLRFSCLFSMQFTDAAFPSALYMLFRCCYEWGRRKKLLDLMSMPLSTWPVYLISDISLSCSPCFLFHQPLWRPLCLWV